MKKCDFPLGFTKGTGHLGLEGSEWIRCGKPAVEFNTYGGWVCKDHLKECHKRGYKN